MNVGHGCVKCDFDLCAACVATAADLNAKVLDLLSLKTCRKIALTVGDPALVNKLVDELSRHRVQQIVGQILGFTGPVSCFG